MTPFSLSAVTQYCVFHFLALKLVTNNPVLKEVNIESVWDHT